MQQADLFPRILPRGLEYCPDFLSTREERELLEVIRGLPLQAAQYKEFTARRRTVSYGSTYDFSTNTSSAAEPIAGFLEAVRSQVARWCAVDAESFVQALIAEYRPGTPLGWHRDVPEFELIAGISLAGACCLRFRPFPWAPERKRERFTLELMPRSAYVLKDAARWQWQHSIPPTKELRYSITFRTRRTGTLASAKS